MQRVDVTISPSVLTWIMAHCNFNNLQPKIYDLLKDWVEGVKLPTYKQVEAVSKATGIPFGYFFLANPPKEDLSIIMNYRTIDSVGVIDPSRELINTLQYAESVQEWTKNHLIAENEEKLPFVGKFKNESNVVSLGKHVRKILSIEVDWWKTIKTPDAAFRYIRQKISFVGVLVLMNGVVGNNTKRILNIDEFRAFALIDDYAPLVFINSNDSYNGRIFSLLHEFVHILLGTNSFYNYVEGANYNVTREEQICNAVAAEILIPNSYFKTQWNKEKESITDIEKIITNVGKNFYCSNIVVARKALDNGYINQKDYIHIVQLIKEQYKTAKKRQKSGGDFYRTLYSRIDRRFFNMLYTSVLEGKTLYTDAFQLTHTNRNTFDHLVKEVQEVRYE